MRKLAVVLTVLALWPPLLAEADSDGYFCVGRGYLAYETRFSGNSDRHQLHVVRFGTASGIVAAPPVLMEDFQVHGMVCRPGGVDLLAWTTMYSVDISNPQRPLIATRPATFVASGAKPAQNLGHWAKEQVVDLEVDNAPGVFQLVIARVSRRVPGGVDHFTISRVIRRDWKGVLTERIIASFILFEGVFRESIDGPF